MIIKTSWVVWCGSHVPCWEKKEKLWTCVFLKPHQGKNLNLPHGKYSTWEIRVIFFFMMSLVFVVTLWLHTNNATSDQHENFWGSSWSKLLHKKVDDVIGLMIRQPYWIYPQTYKKNLLQNGWTDRVETSHTFTQALGIPGCSRIVDRSKCLAAILDWSEIFKK